MNSLENIDQYVARLLMVSFFLPPKVGMFAAIGSCLYFFIRTMLLRDWSPRRNYLWAFFLGSSFLLYLLAIPLTQPEYRKVLLHICERRESFLLFPLVFAIMAADFRILIREELIYFMYACFISCAVANADFIYHFLSGHEGTHPLSHVLYRMYFEAITGLHPTYMGMYLAFSICILLQSSLFNEGAGRVVKYFVAYILLVFLLSLLAKSPLLALIVIGVHTGYKQRSTLAKYKAAIFGALAAMVATAFAIPFFRQRMGEMLNLFGKGNTESAANNSVAVRKLIWHIDTDLIARHWLKGVGPGRLLHVLHERYFFFSLSNGFPVGYYDPHNEYFSQWLAFGVLGILLFVGIMVVQFSKAIKVKDYLYLYLLIILAITFCTETVISRQQGVIFYGVFTSLFFFYDQVRGEKVFAKSEVKHPARN